MTGCFAMADGKLFRLIFIIVLVHAAAAFVASCAKPQPKMDWKRMLDEAGFPP